jgi:hypothetical protein
MQPAPTASWRQRPHHDDERYPRQPPGRRGPPEVPPPTAVAAADPGVPRDRDSEEDQCGREQQQRWKGYGPAQPQTPHAEAECQNRNDERRDVGEGADGKSGKGRDDEAYGDLTPIRTKCVLCRSLGDHVQDDTAIGSLGVLRDSRSLPP